MKRPYLILSRLLGFVFVYLLLTQMYDRYSSTWSMYSYLQRRRASIIDPGSLPAERAHLLAERDSLSRLILASGSRYRQNETGVIQCVMDNARREHVLVNSFSPGTAVSKGGFTSFPFSLSVDGRFDQVTVLINDLEQAAIPFDMVRVDMISNPIGEPTLKTTLQVRALLYDGFEQEEH